jgi:hypothetical protein
LFFVARKNERLGEAHDNHTARNARHSKTLKLKEKLGDHKRDQERDRLLLESDLNAKFSNKQKH